MKIAKYITSSYTFPYPKNEVFAPYDVAEMVTRGLISHGHEVSWFAPKGTVVPDGAALIDCDITAVKQDPRFASTPSPERRELGLWADAIFLSEIVKRADEFDIIHLDTFVLAAVFAKMMPTKPVVVTVHNPLNTPPIQAVIDYHQDLPNLYWVSVSDSQRQPAPHANWFATIYHGLDVEKYPFNDNPSDKWIFASRIIPAKGLHNAVKAVSQRGEKLDIFGPIHPSNQQYFDEQIAPYLNNDIVYHGKIDRNALPEHYGRAKGFLFPIEEPEAFGLVVIESLACGTPVITHPLGAMPEIIENGKTGQLLQDRSVDALVKAMDEVSKIDRSECRKVVETKFSFPVVAENYSRVFSDIVSDFSAKKH